MDSKNFIPNETEEFKLPRIQLSNQFYDKMHNNIPNSAPYIRSEVDENRNSIDSDIPMGVFATIDPHPHPTTTVQNTNEFIFKEHEDIDFGESSNIFSKILESIHAGSGDFVNSHKQVLKYIIIFILFAAYNAYLITAIAYQVRHNDEIPMDWCRGLGFLIVLTGIVYWSLFYYFILKTYFGKTISKNVLAPANKVIGNIFKIWYARALLALLIIIGFLTFIILDTKDDRKRLISFCGIIALVLLQLLLSKHPGRVKWRHVFWGLALQYIFGLLILRWDLGRDILNCISEKVEIFLKYTLDGSGFVYGYLATGFSQTFNTTEAEHTVQLRSVFAFDSLSTVFFFSFMVGIFYHIGAMTWIVSKVGWLLQITIGTTACESMVASANIFLGQTEAPLVVKPFINEMTSSEINSVLTSGFATIAGTVLGAFIGFGISASHLLSASLMSAPAALACAKIIYPETKVSRTKAKNIESISPKSEGNFMDAATQGASQAFFLVGNIIASLIAVTAAVGFLNGVMLWFGGLVGLEDFTFEWLLSKLFIPIAYCIGIESEDVEDVALLIGIKTVLNEFVAYERLAQMTHLKERSKTIATYALCCFANFSSIGIQLGGMTALAPARRTHVSEAIWRAFIAGNCAALMTACVAGSLS